MRLRTVLVWILVVAAEMTDQLAVGSRGGSLPKAALWSEVINPEVVCRLQQQSLATHSQALQLPFMAAVSCEACHLSATHHSHGCQVE